MCCAECFTVVSVEYTVAYYASCNKRGIFIEPRNAHGSRPEKSKVKLWSWIKSVYIWFIPADNCTQKSKLLDSPVVQDYLGLTAEDQEEDEEVDFS
jgi:hypothetical protein